MTTADTVQPVGARSVALRRKDNPVAKRTRYEEYKDRYANFKFELSDEGVLFMQCHTNGDSLVWDWGAHDGMSDAFADIAGDREIKVLIHTGTGENYNANWARLPVPRWRSPCTWRWTAKRGSSSLTRRRGTAGCSSRTSSPSKCRSSARSMVRAASTLRFRYWPTSCWLPRPPTSRTSRTSRVAWCRVMASTSSGPCSSGGTGPVTCCSWVSS